MFAENLKALRKAKGMTQTDLSQVLNVAQGAVAMWETGKRIPDLDMLKRIANYFNVSMDSLSDNETPFEKGQDQLNDVYFSFAKRAQDDGIAPEDIEMAIEMIKHLKHKGQKGE